MHHHGGLRCHKRRVQRIVCVHAYWYTLEARLQLFSKAARQVRYRKQYPQPESSQQQVVDRFPIVKLKVGIVYYSLTDSRTVMNLPHMIQQKEKGGLQYMIKKMDLKVSIHRP